MYYVISIEFLQFSDFADQGCQVDSPIDLCNSINSSHPLAPVTLDQSIAIDRSTTINTTYCNLWIWSIAFNPIQCNQLIDRNQSIATDQLQPTNPSQSIQTFAIAWIIVIDSIQWIRLITIDHIIAINSIHCNQSIHHNRQIATDRSQPTDRNGPITTKRSQSMNLFKPSQSLESS